MIGYARDLSSRGLFFYTRGKLAAGNRLSLTIFPSIDWIVEQSPPRLEVEGKVLRSERTRRPSPDGEMRGVAVEFSKKPVLRLGGVDTNSMIRDLERMPSPADIPA